MKSTVDKILVHQFQWKLLSSVFLHYRCLWFCDRSSKAQRFNVSNERLTFLVHGIIYMYVLTFGFLGEILVCDHSDESCCLSFSATMFVFPIRYLVFEMPQGDIVLRFSILGCWRHPRQTAGINLLVACWSGWSLPLVFIKEILKGFNRKTSECACVGIMHSLGTATSTKINHFALIPRPI